MTNSRFRCMLAFSTLSALGCSDGAAPASYRSDLGACGESTSGSGAVTNEGGETGNGGSTPAGGATAAGSAASAGATSAAGGAAAFGGRPSGGGNPSAGGKPASAGAAGEPALTCNPPLPDSSKSEFLCDPSEGLACDNCGDCKQIIDGSAKTAAASCGVQCPSNRSCGQTCLKSKTTLTDPCQNCLLDYADCLVANCIIECLNSATDPAPCKACSRAKPSPTASCSIALEKCSGAHPNPASGG